MTSRVLTIAFTLSITSMSASSTPVTAVSDLPDAVIFEIEPSTSVFDPFGPFTASNANGTATGTAVTFRLDIETIEDPPQIGFFSEEPFTDLFPDWYDTVDPAINPGDYTGRYTGDRLLIMTFDQGVAGVGFTLHSAGNGVMTTGSIITAYDGPDGTGSVIGTVTTPDTPEECCPFTTPAPYNHLYFGGVRSDEGLIRSVIVEPLVASQGWGIDTVAIAPAAGPAGCNAADLAETFGILDLADIGAFVVGFTTQDPIADLDSNGIWDLSDIGLFVAAFTGGCP